MSSLNRFAIDAMVFIDFACTDEEARRDQGKANVKNWLNEKVGEAYTELISTPTILIEVAQYLFFTKRHNPRQVRHVVLTLKRTFYNLSIPDQGSYDIEGVCNGFSKVAQELQCHAGELSLLPHLVEPGTTFVSSDKNALRAFKMVPRLDPSFSPPVIAEAGDEIPNT